MDISDFAMIEESYWAEFEPVLGISELARIFRKTNVTIWKWLNEAKIPGHNIGGKWIVYLEDVRSTIEGDGSPYQGLPDELLSQYGTELSVEDLRTLTGLSRNTVYRRLADGTLPAHQIAGAWLIYKNEFVELLRRTSNQHPNFES